MITSSTRHYYQITKIVVGVDISGEIEYRVRASVDRITGIGKTIEEAFKNLQEKLQGYEKYRFDWKE